MQISGCTAVILSNAETPTNLATAFDNRGVALNGKVQHDQAIADLDQAIRLNPNCAEAFFNRGNGHSGNGESDLAIQGYDQAIRLKPDYAVAFYSRGTVYDGKL